MLRRRFKWLVLVFLMWSLDLHGQYLRKDHQPMRVSIETLGTYYCDPGGQLTLSQILEDSTLAFKAGGPSNLGLSYDNCWVKLPLKNTTDQLQTLYLIFESTVVDSFWIYRTSDHRLVGQWNIGEALPYADRIYPHRHPIIPIALNPGEEVTYFIKAVGSGQPMSVAAHLATLDQLHDWDIGRLFFLGTVYGIVFIILILNFSYLLVSKDSIYFYFCLEILAVLGCLFYFDGFVHAYLFQDHGYWNNQFIAISLCLSFIFSNKFSIDFFHLKTLAPLAYKAFRWSIGINIILLILSFFHPWGFNLFISGILAMTSIIALLLFVSILTVKFKGFKSYLFGLIATVCLIIFGSTFQLFCLGYLPDNFFTHHSMHFAIATQSIFMALAVHDHIRLMREENLAYQHRLTEASTLYSRNLITTLEAERQRLARDIHDSLGQNLLAIRNRLLLMVRQNKSSEEIKESLHALIDSTAETLEEARSISYHLRPPILNALGLSSAINALVEHMRANTDLEIHFTMPQSIDGIIPKEEEINLYRILQECFANAVKHAQAEQVELTITAHPEHCTILFSDNGVGYNTATVISGQGLIGIQERVKLLNGILKTTSTLSRGTHIQIHIPRTITPNTYGTH